MTGMDRFHAHLDVCARCAKNPFDLCAEGRILLLLCGETGKPVGEGATEAGALVAALESAP